MSEELERQWASLKLPTENVSAHEAERLMLSYLEMREDWAGEYVLAIKREDTCKWKFDTAYNLAFLRSEETSDKKRDIDAQGASLVKAAKLAHIESKAGVVKAKLKLEGAQLAHHALKRIFEEACNERRFL